jgi:putative endonuclease
MNSYTTGQQGEQLAIEYLERHGYSVVDRNWKTTRCEIDIIATRAQTVYFIEVKFRADLSHSDGYDYITAKKLRQMHFAAQIWIQNNQWLGDFSLGVMSVTNNDAELLLDIY